MQTGKIIEKVRRFREMCLLVALSLAANPALAEPDIDRLFASLVEAGRLSIESTEPLATPVGQAIKVIGAFEFSDPKGTRQTARGKFVLPPAVVRGDARNIPLIYSAGYEAPDSQAAGYALQGYATVTPFEHPLNPLSRTPSLDIALLHIARSLPYVDDSRVVVTGGSAGGYTTLMLAAETFPLAGGVPDVPVLNLGYNVEYFYANKHRVLGTTDEQGNPTAPVLALVMALTDQLETYLPPDRDSKVWFEHSPIGHLERITCPVTATFSTADILVPIDQVGAGYVVPRSQHGFPEGYVCSPHVLMKSRYGRAELLQLLHSQRYKIIHYTLPTVAERMDAPPSRPAPILVTPLDGRRQWDIVIIHEGPVFPEAGHFGHRFGMMSNGVIAARLVQPIAVDQLTRAKLEQLMSRYADREWMSESLPHLDTPEAERADVLRGLRTYVRQGAGHAERFAKLYGELPSDLRVLPQAIRAADASKLGAVLNGIEP